MEVKQVKTENINKPNINSAYRHILNIIINNPPSAIEVGDWTKVGDINFSIKLKDLGLEYDDFDKYEDEFLSYFVIDFIGELLIRENSSIFIEKLQDYNFAYYENVVEEFGMHKNFGVKIKNGRLVLTFHVSLLERLLTESYRDILG
jgi:hypothetical protein